MAGTLNLKIVTPDRIVLEQTVEQVAVKAVDGELCILPKHEPIVTALDIDLLRYRVQGEEMTAAVMGGVLEVNEDNVTVLSDMAELDLEIDEARAQQRKDRAEAEKMQKVDKLDVYVAEMAIAKAFARLKAAEYARRRGNRNPGVR